MPVSSFGRFRLNAVVGADGLVPCGTLTVLVHHFARFIKDVRPRYLCVAFDAGRATFRHDMYPLYKQHRPPAPPQLLPFFGLAPKVFEVLGARTFSEPGMSAIYTRAFDQSIDQQTTPLICRCSDAGTYIRGQDSRQTMSWPR